MESVLQLAESLMSSPWLLALVLVLVLLDALLPIVPAETVVITAGAYAVSGDPQALPVVLAAATGAVIGDLTAHHIGRGAGPLTRMLRRRRLGGAVVEWAERGLTARGGMIIVAARFVPGGRTATTVTSGLIGYPRSRFLLFAAIASLAWSLYSVGIGMIGGLAFREQPLIGVAVGIALALAVGGGIELIRSSRARRSPGVTGPRPAEPGERPAPGRVSSGSPDSARRPTDRCAADAV